MWWRNHDNTFSRFDTVPACDRQTDVQPISIMCFSVADARKNVGEFLTSSTYGPPDGPHYGSDAPMDLNPYTRANFNVRWHFFTERLLNRWNSLNQYTVKADTVNSFKRELQRMKHWMGFLEDWRLINRTATQVLYSGLVWPHQVNDMY